MWLLKDKDGKLTYLKPNRIFTVGRKEGTLVLPENSVSRHHAEITVVSRKDIVKIENNMEPLSNCIIKDPGSKYGNFILKEGDIEVRVTKDGYTFKHMDRVRFGVQDSIYTVMYMPMITATSGLDATEKNALRLIIDTIDGKITAGWETNCTHMTVSNPNISEKLTCALAYGTPIVPMEYWKFVLKAFEANEEMPNPLDFARLINEKMAMLGNISVLPNPLRRTLFKDLTFIHFDSQQYKLYERMIRIAGGKSLLYRNETHRNLDLCDDNFIVVQLLESNTTQATGTGDAKYALACEKLGRIRRRTIPTGEIALAIYHVSTEKCCNPKYDYAEMFKAQKSNKPSGNSSVLAQDTQDVDFPPTTSRHGELVSRTTDRVTKNSGKSAAQNYIKESIEESSSINTQPAEIARPKSSNYLSGSSEGSCLGQLEKSTQRKASLRTQDSQLEPDCSIKVASLNWEKYVEEEFNSKTSINDNSMKRNREEDEKIDTTKKKICLDVLIDEQRNDKLSAKNKKADISYEDMMPDDEDFMFIDGEDTNEDLFKNNQKGPGSGVSQKMIDNENLRKKSIAERDVRAADRDVQHKIASKSTSSSNFAGKYETPCKFQLEDRTNLKHQNEEETSRKRKIGRPEHSPWDIDSPLKRNKVTTDDATKSSKVFLKVATVEKNRKDFSSSKEPVDAKTEWTPIKKSPKSLGDLKDRFTTNMNISTNGENKSVNCISNRTDLFKKPGDPDESLQPLLRIESPDDVSSLTLPKFGKSFRKAYRLIPMRIEMDDMVDMHSWGESNKVPKTHISSDEEDVTPQKVSLSTSKKKKTLRV